MPIIYSIIVILISVNLLFGIQRAVNLTQAEVLASNNLSNNQKVAQEEVIASYTERVDQPEDKGLAPPNLSAISAIVLDPTTNFIFFEKYSEKRVPIASTTKIMTALVALYHYSLDDILVVQDLIVGKNGSSMGLRLGEKITVESLLYGLLLNSGNDAAYVLAQNYPGGVKEFIGAMNQKSIDLALNNTHFDNPAGFDSPNHYSSASDLSKIAVYLQRNEVFSKIVTTRQISVTSVDGNIIHKLINLNKLLAFPEYLGIKTGYSSVAKENLVAAVKKDDHQILTVVLGSNDRFGETKALVDWVFENFSWE